MVSQTNDPTAGLRYNRVAIWLHWLIGLAVILNIALAMLTEGLPKEIHRAAMGLHKEVGISILVLTVLRIAWRLTHKAPALPVAMANWQRLARNAVHFLFYALLILLPLSGWMWMSAADSHINYFGLFTLPALTGHDKALADVLHDRHEFMGLMMLALVAIHILAALKHQYLDRDQLMARINPFG